MGWGRGGWGGVVESDRGMAREGMVSCNEFLTHEVVMCGIVESAWEEREGRGGEAREREGRERRREKD